MKVLIIEDEIAAVRRLRKMILELLPEAEILADLDTVSASIEWLGTKPQPNLLFMDIHLADGPSFDILEEVEVSCPVIFTTAYDQYALQAFQLNSIDYLLKPIKKEALGKAIEKYKRLHDSPAEAVPQGAYEQLIAALQKRDEPFQKRIIIRYGQHIKALEIADIAYFFIESKVTLCRTREGKEYPVDYNLDQLEGILNPADFFRINRKCIIHIDAIAQMYAYSKSRVKIDLIPPFADETIVSAERSPRFKIWLLGKG